MNFSVMFYREVDGTKPVGLFIRGLDLKMKAKVVANLNLLEEYGNLAREPLLPENRFQRNLMTGYLNFVP